ncbi:Uncharacterized protein FGIG_11392 [Fasciola gigantica]|uniref:DUF1279 domain-containing protein n=1 Tax=Fasciola gigantica TaxID=46835 RepID=A0A504YLG0_FASGI|nr:Uncharacterized protein FGIG_11392 [Fasciola gigantica]
MSAIGFGLSNFFRRSFTRVQSPVSFISGIHSNLICIDLPQRSLCTISSSCRNLLVHHKPVRPVHLQSSTLSQPEENKKETEIKAKKSSLIQRFKESYAIYGKLVIVIHGLTSCVWFGSAYLVASTGINLLDLLEAAHFPEWVCRPLRMGGGVVNTWATTLILYKLIAPIRYGATLILTRYAVHYLRAKGKVPQIAERDRLRNLARESAQISRERLKIRLSKGRTKVISMSKKAMRGHKKD